MNIKNANRESKIIKKHPNGRILWSYVKDGKEYSFHATKGLRVRQMLQQKFSD